MFAKVKAKVGFLTTLYLLAHITQFGVTAREKLMNAPAVYCTNGRVKTKTRLLQKIHFTIYICIYRSHIIFIRRVYSRVFIRNGKNRLNPLAFSCRYTNKIHLHKPNNFNDDVSL